MRKAANVTVLLLFLSSLLALAPVSAEASPGKQEGIRVLYESASYTFAKEMVFEIGIASELREANLFFKIEGEIGRHYHRADIYRTRAKEVIHLRPGEIPPAAKITYFWRLEDTRRYLWRTKEKSFLYLDKRFPWRSQKREDITLFWYTGNGQFADTVFDQLDRSFDRIEERLGFGRKETIKVVIYQSWDDMRSALSVRWDGQSIVVGAAFGHRILIFCRHRYGWEETLTHELTHLLTYQLMGEPYDYLPFWLSEGLATHTESRSRGAITDPLRLSYLSSQPTQSELVEPAYAQAQSLVTFLVEEHGGKEKINQLLETMAEGTAIDDALLTVYGFDHHGLEKEWRKWIGKPLPEEVEEVEVSEPKRPAIPIVPIAVGTICLLAFIIFLLVVIIMRQER